MAARTSAEFHFDVHALPDEVARLVTAGLDALSLIRLAAVSRGWRALAVSVTHGFSVPHLASEGVVEQHRFATLTFQWVPFKCKAVRPSGPAYLGCPPPASVDVAMMDVGELLELMVQREGWAEMVRLVRVMSTYRARCARNDAAREVALASRRRAMCAALGVVDLHAWLTANWVDAELDARQNRHLVAFMTARLLRTKLRLEGAVREARSAARLASVRQARRAELDAELRALKLDRQPGCAAHEHWAHRAFVFDDTARSAHETAERIAYDYWMKFYMERTYRETVRRERRLVGPRGHGYNWIPELNALSMSTFRAPKRWPWL